MSYTPGPWKLDRQRFNNDEHDDKLGSVVSEDGGFEWIIAEVCGDIPDCAKDNARLIAAAPELLEAAKYSLRVGYGSDDCGDHCGNSCHWCELRRAIAKAEGEP